MWEDIIQRKEKEEKRTLFCFAPTNLLRLIKWVESTRRTACTSSNPSETRSVAAVAAQGKPWILTSDWSNYVLRSYVGRSSDDLFTDFCPKKGSSTCVSIDFIFFRCNGNTRADSRQGTWKIMRTSSTRAHVLKMINTSNNIFLYLLPPYYSFFFFSSRIWIQSLCWTWQSSPQ